MADVLSVIADIIKQDKQQKREHNKVMREVKKKMKEAEVSEEEGDQGDYSAFVQKKLKKYGVSSPAELSQEEKKKFFDEIDREWEGKNEKPEPEDEQADLGTRVKERMKAEDEEEPEDEDEDPVGDPDETEEEEEDMDEPSEEQLDKIADLVVQKLKDKAEDEADEEEEPESTEAEAGEEEEIDTKPKVEGTIQRNPHHRGMWEEALKRVYEEKVPEPISEIIKSVGKELRDYALKSGGIDKNDFLKISDVMQKGKMPKAASINRMDTDPREFVFDLMAKTMGWKYVEQYGGIRFQHRRDYVESFQGGHVLQEHCGECEESIEEVRMPEGLNKEGAAEFMAAASAAKKQGKKKFKFGDKEYPVTIKIDIPTEETDVDEKMKTPKYANRKTAAAEKAARLRAQRKRAGLDESDKAMMMKLTTKAMKAIPNSPDQKELIKQVNVYRKKLGMKPMKEEVEIDEAKGEFEVKYASSKRGPIKVSKFNTLDDAKKFLAQVKKEGMNGIISKGGKPVKEDEDLEKIVKELEGASKMHLGQSKRIKKHLDKMKEDVEQEIEESVALQMKMAADDIETYAKKHGGIDKKDMMKAASMLKKGDKKGALKFIKTLDTDPRDYLLKTMGEEVEIDEDMKYHYYNLDRGVYRMQKDNNGKIIGKMHDRQKEMRAGFPNADEVLSTTKQAAAKVAKLNEALEEKASDYEDQIKAFLAKGGKIQKGDRPNKRKIDMVTKGFMKKYGSMKKKEADLDAKDKEELEKMMGEAIINEAWIDNDARKVERKWSKMDKKAKKKWMDGVMAKAKKEGMPKDELMDVLDDYGLTMEATMTGKDSDSIEGPAKGVKHKCPTHVKKEGFGYGKNISHTLSENVVDKMNIYWFDTQEISTLMPTSEVEVVTEGYHSMKNHREKFKSTNKIAEGYMVLPAIDRNKYTPMRGMEGPFPTMSGKVLYYDPKAGEYYDRDSDMYISYDQYMEYDKMSPSQRKQMDMGPLGDPKSKEYKAMERIKNKAEKMAKKNRLKAKNESVGMRFIRKHYQKDDE